ncbi:unnamed protein product [Protopolystoma xenopodis]|uniref:Uncharacterized protein n=1 Tax=Protopolystoma xenopodis TaxID=117903 RepID=A0A3S5FCZ5_9PLAT|nr:unnamed protein product [Protopolystoma xenopodis]
MARAFIHPPPLISAVPDRPISDPLEEASKTVSSLNSHGSAAALPVVEKSVSLGKTRCLGSSASSFPFALALQECLLHEALLCLGQLAALHPENQAALQAGHPPTLLQRLLIRLPLSYQTRAPLNHTVYPTLVACCYANPRNTALVRQELASCRLIAAYIQLFSLTVSLS